VVERLIPRVPLVLAFLLLDCSRQSAITAPKMTVLNTGRFAGLLHRRCPETPHTVLCGRRVPKRHRTLGVSYPFGNRPLTHGTRTPVMLVFDEVWKIRDKYPHILDVVKRGARQGRKENAVTMLATQAYEDFVKLYDITRTAGLKVNLASFIRIRSLRSINSSRRPFFPGQKRINGPTSPIAGDQRCLSTGSTRNAWTKSLRSRSKNSRRSGASERLV
jgi:hypothetical protein